MKIKKKNEPPGIQSEFQAKPGQLEELQGGRIGLQAHMSYWVQFLLKAECSFFKIVRFRGRRGSLAVRWFALHIAIYFDPLHPWVQSQKQSLNTTGFGPKAKQKAPEPYLKAPIPI